ncbi:MAG TPA: transcriptional repressor LexA [Chitinispirillaceae bacterium]|nr:transcriptional repressor LexA [Chitinispirillaceae bacterium]
MTVFELTSEQQRVYSFIIKHRQQTGFPPTVREIAQGLGYKSPNNVRQHLRLIEQKGFIRLMAGKARGIEITSFEENQPDEADESVSVPLIGTVAAGKPITAIENVDGYVTLDKSIFKGEGLFALRIRGDSMNGMGILNGDIVVVRRKSTAEHGEVVVVIIDGDATLKRFIKENGRVLLRAENPAYSDIVLSSMNSIQIAGKLVGVIRKY